MVLPQLPGSMNDKFILFDHTRQYFVSLTQSSPEILHFGSCFYYVTIGKGLNFVKGVLMAKSSVIDTERLRIEPFSSQHLTERYVAWLADPEVVRFSEQRNDRHTFETCCAYMNSFSETPNFFWALVEKDPEIGHLGNMTAYVDMGSSSADIGILIGERRVWNRGYGREAWQAVLRYLFVVEKVSQVTAGTLVVNKSMLALMNAVGMACDKKRSGRMFYEGSEIDCYYAIIDRASFLMRENQSTAR